MRVLELNLTALLVGWRSEGGKQSLLVQPCRGRAGREVPPGGTEWTGCCLWWHRNHHSLQKTGRHKDIYLQKNEAACFQITSIFKFLWYKYLIIKVHGAEKSDNWSIEFYVMWHFRMYGKSKFLRNNICFHTTFTLYNICKLISYEITVSCLNAGRKNPLADWQAGNG